MFSEATQIQREKKEALRLWNGRGTRITIEREERMETVGWAIVHLKWVRCNKRNAAKRGGGNPARSKAVRRARKSSACPAPGDNASRQSAPGATSVPKPSPPVVKYTIESILQSNGNFPGESDTNLTDDRLVAGRTASLGSGGNPLFVHVGL